MVSVFGGFVLGDDTTIRQFGFALAVGILLPTTHQAPEFQEQVLLQIIRIVKAPLARLQPQDGPTDPQPGATSLSGWTVAWDESTVLSGRGGVPLLDPSRADAPLLAHIVTDPMKN